MSPEKEETRPPEERTEGEARPRESSPAPPPEGQAGEEARPRESSPAPPPDDRPPQKARPTPLIIGAAVLVGLLAVAIVYLYSQIQSQKRELREEVLHREATELSLQEARSDLSSRMEQLSRLQEELQSTVTERERLERNLAETRSERDRLETNLETVSERMEFFRERLEAEEKTVVSLNERLDRERESQRVLLSRVERLLDEKSELERKVSRLEEGVLPDDEVAIPGLVVRRPVARLQGTILTVNRRFDFAVVDLGRRDGISPGDRFRVIDREEVIGELVARRVEPAMTVADVDPEKTRRRLRPDMTVAFE